MERLLESGEVHEPEQVDESVSLQAELDELRDDFEALRSNYERDRKVWAGILANLRAAFSGAQVAAPESASGAPMPQSSAAWQMWKDRLPPACGKIIDALLIQPLTMTQMIRVCGLAYSTVKANVAILKNNTLLEKDGDRWKLKRL